MGISKGNTADTRTLSSRAADLRGGGGGGGAEGGVGVYLSEVLRVLEGEATLRIIAPRFAS